MKKKTTYALKRLSDWGDDMYYHSVAAFSPTWTDDLRDAFRWDDREAASMAKRSLEESNWLNGQLKLVRVRKVAK